MEWIWNFQWNIVGALIGGWRGKLCSDTNLLHRLFKGIDLLKIEAFWWFLGCSLALIASSIDSVRVWLNYHRSCGGHLLLIFCFTNISRRGSHDCLYFLLSLRSHLLDSLVLFTLVLIEILSCEFWWLYLFFVRECIIYTCLEDLLLKAMSIHTLPFVVRENHWKTILNVLLKTTGVSFHRGGIAPKHALVMWVDSLSLNRGLSSLLDISF